MADNGQCMTNDTVFQIIIHIEYTLYSKCSNTIFLFGNVVVFCFSVRCRTLMVVYTMKSNFNQKVLTVLKLNSMSFPWYRLLSKMTPNFDKPMLVQIMINHPIHYRHV